MRFPQPLTPGVLVTALQALLRRRRPGRRPRGHRPLRQPRRHAGPEHPRPAASGCRRPTTPSARWPGPWRSSTPARQRRRWSASTPCCPTSWSPRPWRPDALPELTGYETVRREVKYGEASRIDFLLTGPDRPACWLEVKNCHLRRVGGTLAEFPDCIAARSAKHLRELAAMKALGDRAVVLFTVQREDCDAFSACRDIDPKFAAGARRGGRGRRRGADLRLRDEHGDNPHRSADPVDQCSPNSDLSCNRPRVGYPFASARTEGNA
jgi:hypothetical protein